MLPKEKVKPLLTSPKSLLLYSIPKNGKTTALSLLDDCLIVDTEDGTDYLEALAVKATTPKEFENICREIFAAGYNKETKEYTPPYKVIAIDTLTRIDEWSEDEGTARYMESVQGGKFNRHDATTTADKSKWGQLIAKTDVNWRTVHEIGQGFGYRYSREYMINWFNRICKLAPRVIFVCHVKDKFVADKKGETIQTKDISLTGKVKDIIASKVDTIGFLSKKGDKVYITFGEDTDTVSGTRCQHLSGKTICITEKIDNEIISHWDEVYID